MTLNQIIAKIQTQAESHKMVGKFGALDLANKLQTYNFALLVMDRVFESESNVIEVLSDTAQIMGDIFALLDSEYQDEVWQLVVNQNASPFYDSRTDILAGYAINFSIQVPYLANTCVVPV